MKDIIQHVQVGAYLIGALFAGILVVATAEDPVYLINILLVVHISIISIFLLLKKYYKQI